jgi:hypothetical protein
MNTAWHQMIKEAGIPEPELGVKEAGLIDTAGTSTDAEIARNGMIAELDAVNQYETAASKTRNKMLAKLLLDVAKEEKVHSGEFMAALLELDKEQGPEMNKGLEEAAGEKKASSGHDHPVGHFAASQLAPDRSRAISCLLQETSKEAAARLCSCGSPMKGAWCPKCRKFQWTKKADFLLKSPAPVEKTKDRAARYARNLGILGLAGGAGVYAAGKYGIGNNDVSGLEDFARMGEGGIEQVPTAERLDKYTELGSRALNTKLFGTPAGMLMQNMKNLPLVQDSTKEQLGDPDHYFKFMRGPLSGQLQLYHEAMLHPDKYPQMTDPATMRQIEARYSDWAQHRYHKPIDLLTPAEQIDVRNTTRTSGFAPPPASPHVGAPMSTVDPSTAHIQAEAAKMDKSWGDWIPYPMKDYTAGAIRPVLQARDTIQHYGGYAAAAGAGLLGAYGLYKYFQKKPKPAAPPTHVQLT